jgi:hypothetical protein
MKKLAVLGSLLLIVCRCATADEPPAPSADFSVRWSQADTNREITWQVLNALDAWQTAQIHKRNDIEEGNAIARTLIGAEPSSSDVAMYFGTMAVSHYLISKVLRPKWRAWYQRGTIGYSAYVIGSNCFDYSNCL